MRSISGKLMRVGEKQKRQIVRAFSVYMVFLTVFTLHISHFPYIPLTPSLVIEWICLGIAVHAGIWYITTRHARSHWILATLVYCPVWFLSWGFCPAQSWVGLFSHFLLLTSIYLFFLLRRTRMYPSPLRLRAEATQEVYLFIDLHVRRLPKSSDGKFFEASSVFQDNEVDALRHAYVSGVFAQTYGQRLAEIFGQLNEMNPVGLSNPNHSAKSTNMDYWNNEVGRRYAKNTLSKTALLDALHKALGRGELIIDLDDPRKHVGLDAHQALPTDFVVVLERDRRGRNEVFFDAVKERIMSRKDFLKAIRVGLYPNYGIRRIRRYEFPVSKRDGSTVNNLG